MKIEYLIHFFKHERTITVIEFHDEKAYERRAYDLNKKLFSTCKYTKECTINGINDSIWCECKWKKITKEDLFLRFL